jgi:hypothetical protein
MRGVAPIDQAFEAAMARLREKDLWTDDNLWSAIAADLPGYRLSKLRSLLPPSVERELVSRYLLHSPSTWRELR